MKRMNVDFSYRFLPDCRKLHGRKPFEVEHSHSWRSCKGKLVFGDTTVEYIAEKKEHSRSWKYEDIQQLAIAPERISILTFNARKIEFGADQAFNFKLLSGSIERRVPDGDVEES